MIYTKIVNLPQQVVISHNFILSTSFVEIHHPKKDGCGNCRTFSRSVILFFYCNISALPSLRPVLHLSGVVEHCIAQHYKLFCTAPYYTTLHFTILFHYTALHCTEHHYKLFCTAPYYTTLHFTILFHYTALHCTALHCTLHYCTELHSTAFHCTALHCTAMFCTA